MNYTVIFYEKENGVSEIEQVLAELQTRASKSKDARIQYQQMLLALELLSRHGTQLPEKITKHIEDGIWELRPGVNRIFYFFFKEETFVLLHSFRKRTQKTPRREIEKAKRERADYMARKGKDEHENLGRV